MGCMHVLNAAWASLQVLCLTSNKLKLATGDKPKTHFEGMSVGCDSPSYFITFHESNFSLENTPEDCRPDLQTWV